MITFFHSDKPREIELGNALVKGCGGNLLRLKSPIPDDDSFIGMFGVKSKRLFNECKRLNRNILIFDKGYIRNRKKGSKVWEYWRVSINSHHPTKYLLDECSDDRITIDLKPWKKGKKILIAGSSAKYHSFHDMPIPKYYWTSIVSEIKKHSDREIIYKPKPSYRVPHSIPFTDMRKWNVPIEEVLKEANVMVTHGSNACFESIVSGTPVIVLGDAIAKPISHTKIKYIDKPLKADEESRYKWLSNVFYWQWTLEEIEKGKMWEFIRSKI